MAALKQHAWLLFALCILIGSALAAPPKESDFAPADIDQGKALTSLNQMASANTDAITPRKMRRQAGKCNKGNVRVRREWRTLSKPDRRAYIAAVKCLQTKPSLLSFPGSKSLFDDFVAIHLQQTGNIHLSGTFLTWHRYFTYTYEQRLRNDCGYKGDFPYWEWGLDVKNPATSPVFDGSDTSLSGNGEAIPHQGLILTEPFNPDALIPLPPGSGGGCVKTGPFATMTVHIGPVALAQYGTTTPTSVPNPLDDHPRCLKRDLNAGVASKWTTFRNTTQLILRNNNIELFQAILQGDPRYVRQALGVHGGGHFTIGGDPGADPFISPGDPAFYVHHAQVDRVYWIWQMLDFQNRQGVFGTNTFLNVPPSANTTLDDFIDISPLAPRVKIRDLMNTVGGGPLCYVYA
jgi:tyrosinase